MTQVDQYESLFRSAIHDIYEYELVDIRSVLVVTDLEGDPAKEYLKTIQRFLNIFGTSVKWTNLNRGDFKNTQEVLEKIEELKPDLICSYRNLFSEDWRYKNSLGSYLDVLVQKSAAPVLVLPHPEAGYKHDHAFENTDRVMALTDHLSGDHTLINYAVRFVPTDGKVFLTHIEDETVFERYMDAISKIPAIDTDEANKQISQQLLKAPEQFILSCRQVLKDNNLPVEVENVVRFGHHLADYKELIAEHEIDLLVMNTKHEDQLAMHGLVYPLAVELREIPLLLL